MEDVNQRGATFTCKLPDLKKKKKIERPWTVNGKAGEFPLHTCILELEAPCLFRPLLTALDLCVSSRVPVRHMKWLRSRQRTEGRKPRTKKPLCIEMEQMAAPLTWPDRILSNRCFASIVGSTRKANNRWRPPPPSVVVIHGTVIAVVLVKWNCRSVAF